MTPAVVALACIGAEFMTYCVCGCCCCLARAGAVAEAGCGLADDVVCVFATFLIEFSGTRFSLWQSIEGNAVSCCCCCCFCCCAMDMLVISRLAIEIWIARAIYLVSNTTSIRRNVSQRYTHANSLFIAAANETYFFEFFRFPDSGFLAMFCTARGSNCNWNALAERCVPSGAASFGWWLVSGQQGVSFFWHLSNIRRRGNLQGVATWAAADKQQQPEQTH